MLEELLTTLRSSDSRGALFSSALIADRRITVQCDDRGFFSEMFDTFGGNEPEPENTASDADMRLDIRSNVHPHFGWFRMTGTDHLPVDAREFDLEISRADGLFTRLRTDEHGWTCVGIRGEDLPAMAFRDRECVFSLQPRWRRMIASYLFWRLLRLRSDAVFFHASALGIAGEGTIFVGPSGAGKSTTALALAARGHNFLSDEYAGFVPASGNLIPYRRPVGLRAGPRAGAVDRGLTTDTTRRIAANGFVRIDIDAIFPVAPPSAVPLRRIVFLRGFAPTPALQRIAPGRAELVALQPAMGSFLNVSATRRVFELTSLLSEKKVYQLYPGDPDETASYLEKAFADE